MSIIFLERSKKITIGPAARGKLFSSPPRGKKLLAQNPSRSREVSADSMLSGRSNYAVNEICWAIILR
jgi:hypothetical protein